MSVVAGELESELDPLEEALPLLPEVEGAPEAGAAVDPELSLLVEPPGAGLVSLGLTGLPPAASRMHCSFSAPVMSSQRAVLLCPDALLLLSPVAP